MMNRDRPVWLITGCSTGFGRELARLVLERGWRAVVTARDVSKVSDLVAGRDDQAIAVALDVTDRVQIDAAVAAATARFGRIDVLVNNAGIIEWRTMTETPLDVWQRVIGVNQTGPFLGMKAVAPAMIRQGSGSIINISSVGGLGGSSPCYAYGTTKWAVRGMTRGAAQELGPHGVRVNAILPGTIDSRMIAEQDQAAMVARIPLRRVAQPVEVAKLSLWLASEESAYATGADFLLDGGMRS
jgi:3alpha(or 20beta)-hydroxysteroid dehydrogenase